MKKLFLVVCVLFTVNIMLAQTTTPMPNSSPGNVQTPNSVTNQFNTDYPGIQPAWSMDGSNYRAEYMDGTTGRTITYDPNGKMLTREEQLASGNYPSTIGAYYTKNYPGETYEVWSSTDANGNQTYYTNRNSETYWFDKSGKYKNKTKTKTRKTTSKAK